MVEAIRHPVPDRTPPIPPVLPGAEVDLFKPNDTAFFIMHESNRTDLTTIPQGFKVRNLGLEEFVEKAGYRGTISIVYNPDKARVSFYIHGSREQQLEFEGNVIRTGINAILSTSLDRTTFIFRIGTPNHTRY